MEEGGAEKALQDGVEAKEAKEAAVGVQALRIESQKERIQRPSEENLLQAKTIDDHAKTFSEQESARKASIVILGIHHNANFTQLGNAT